MTKTIKADRVNNMFQLVLLEETDLLNAKRFKIKVEKDGRIINEQSLEALDVALSVYDGMQLFYEKVVKE